jgi:hypothetical protein
MSQFSVQLDELSRVPLLLIEVETGLCNLEPLFEHAAAMQSSAPVAATAIDELTVSLNAFVNQQVSGLRSDAEKFREVLRNYRNADNSVADSATRLYRRIPATPQGPNLGNPSPANPRTGAPSSTPARTTPARTTPARTTPARTTPARSTTPRAPGPTPTPRPGSGTRVENARAAYQALRARGERVDGYNAESAEHRRNNPNSDHGRGLAFDWHVRGPESVRQAMQIPGVRYVIHDRQIYAARDGFRPRPFVGRYPGGGVKLPHTDHIHVNF